MNSFVYLPNTFPEIYGASRLLVGANPRHTLAEARDELDGIEFMNGGGCGVSPRNAWEGKLKWLDKYAPGSTLSSGMSPLPFEGWLGESLLTFGLPSFDYLFTQLKEKRSVEFVFEYSIDGNVDGHSVTMTSLHFSDLDNNGSWDPALENAQLDYIDPNCPSGTIGSLQSSRLVPLSFDIAEKVLQFDWQNGDGFSCDPNDEKFKASITFAFAAGVPTPLSLLGLVEGIRIRCKLRARIKAARKTNL